MLVFETHLQAPPSRDMSMQLPCLRSCTPMLGRSGLCKSARSLVTVPSRWSNAAFVLNEVRRPVRTLKIAGPLGLGICGVLYLLANVAYFSAATPKEISESGITVAAVFFGKVFGKAGKRALR